MPRQFGSNGFQGDKAKTLVLLSLALLGVFIVIILVAFSGKSSAPAQPVAVVPVQKEVTTKMVDVLVPVREMEAGTPLEPALFRKEQRAQVSVSPRTVRDFEEIQNQYARSLIIAGQPLLKDYVTKIRPANAVTAKIPEGHRAVTISVDARSAVEGWVRPGARVDVVWASSIRGQPGVTVIVQNAEVLSAERQIDFRSNPSDPVPSTVTLLVSSQDAAKIQLAQTTGSLTLQLRGDNDPGKGSSGNSITVADLLGGADAAPVAQVKDCSGKVVISGQRYCVKRDGSLEME